MKIIIPIGGNDNIESTLTIDKFIVNLVKKEEKHVLFIPIASGDNQDYIDRFVKYYSSLNCKVSVLCLSKVTNDNLIRSLIFASDIIYIGGGNTAKMMRVFKRCNVNNYLSLAYERGIILTGISAGAMIYFQSGYSDANRSTDPLTPLTYLKCLGLIPSCFCPHYNILERKTFDNFLKGKNLDGIALDDNCALIYQDEQIKGVISSDSKAKGYLLINNEKKEIPQYKGD